MTPFSLLLSTGTKKQIVPTTLALWSRSFKWFSSELRPTEIYRANASSVVNIKTDKSTIGTGIVLRSRGNIIVTCHHIIQDSTNISVGLNEYTWLRAKLINADPIRDIALISICGPDQNLRAIQLGNPTKLRVGEDVFSLGYAYTFSSGIISGLNRKDFRENGQIVENLIQSDCALTSGAPLLDSSGMCIGMGTHGKSLTVSLAIPMDSVSDTVGSLMKLNHKLFAVKRSQKGQFFMTKARETDEHSNQLLEKSENGKTVTVDCHDVEPKDVVRVLGIHLSSLCGISSIQYLKILVGSIVEEAEVPRKRLILEQLERDSIAWIEEENGKVIVIKVDEINPTQVPAR